MILFDMNRFYLVNLMINSAKEISIYYFIACISFVLGLFMQDFFKVPLTAGIILIGLSWIFSFSFKEKLKLLMTEPAAIAFILLYFLHLLSMLYTENLHIGWNDLRLKISFLLLPFFIASSKFISSQQRLFILRFFAVLMMLMASIDIILSFLEYLDGESTSVFYYVQLPHVLASKVHYVAWYYSIAIFITFYQIITDIKWRNLWILGLLFLLVSLLLLSSRIFLIAFTIVFSVSFLNWAKAYGIFGIRGLKIVVCFFMFIGLLFLMPITNSRINDAVVELKNVLGNDIQKQTNARVFLWRYGVDLISEKPILGYGVGDAKMALGSALESCEAEFWDGQRNIPIQNKNYNFHNQFMQTWAEVGIFGFFALLFIMIHPFLLKNTHPLFLIFVALTFIGFLTESMLERQAGVLLFAFMYPLLAGLKRFPEET